MKKRIAIIGAGISGLSLAHHLKPYMDCVIFEKARGVGGRMSTRYADEFFFDHGAQFFTARNKEFQKFLAPYIQTGLIQEWSGKIINLEIGKKESKRMWFEPHYVAAPNMNSLCKYLAEELTIHLNTEVAPLTQKGEDGWSLLSKENISLGVFDWVISTAPAAQASTLFHHFLPKNAEIDKVSMKGCYALMIGFKVPWDKKWIAAQIDNNPLRWISVNSTKPARSKELTTFVVHSTHSWAEEHINDDMQAAQEFLVGQFEEITGLRCNNADYLSTHRWRYATIDKADEPKEPECYFDDLHQIAATGDWASVSRIEDAWLNAYKLSKLILKNQN
jgi:renalase